MRPRIVLAALAGMLTIAIVGGLLYGVVFADLFASNRGSATGVMKAPPELLWVGLAHVPFGALLTLVVLWRGKTTATGGAIAGGLLGLLMAASYDLSQYGTTNLWTLELTLVEPFITMLVIGVAGAVVGSVLGFTPRRVAGPAAGRR